MFYFIVLSKPRLCARALNFIADIIVCIKQFSIDISIERGSSGGAAKEEPNRRKFEIGQTTK